MSVGTDQAMRTRIGDQDRRRDVVTSSCELPQGVSDHIEVPPAEPRTITVLPPSTRVEIHTGAARCDPGLLGFPGAFVVDGECPAAPTAPQGPGPAAPRSAVNATGSHGVLRAKENQSFGACAAARGARGGSMHTPCGGAPMDDALWSSGLRSEGQLGE